MKSKSSTESDLMPKGEASSLSDVLPKDRSAKLKQFITLALFVVGLIVCVTSLICILLLPTFVTNQISKVSSAQRVAAYGGADWIVSNLLIDIPTSRSDLCSRTTRSY